MQTAFRSEERFTQAEFRRWTAKIRASDVHRYELLSGHIVMSPPATWLHASVESLLSHRVTEHVLRHRLGRTFGGSAAYELPSGDTLQPDFSFVSNARLLANPPSRTDSLLRVVPDLVVEILSPSTAQRDRTEKAESYAASGVDECWLVDTKRREIAVLFRDGGGFAASRVVVTGRLPSRVLPDLALEVSDLFAGLPSV